ncbi:hypothetical protein DOTSEDRAFT_29350 [Dothistroma septosporum NZE10]|uniref:Hydrophobin n=1 Tax=Dothistroma septosporum (strain NZE10 / CBS 128990) TaxID=675120 RepID=N1PDK4_DOTSN|nr:hypothetical protein DOTSEDRAFT_29350 [Dothistroma septosporum NZE10]
MQFTSLALLSLSAFAFAAPVEEANSLEARGGSSSSGSCSYKNVCCPKSKHSGCKDLPSGKSAPANWDVYNNCVVFGLVNVVVCDILNNDTLNIPITLDLLSS